MTIGFVILAHDRPEYVARTAIHLREQGAAVVVHLDRRAGCLPGLEAALSGACPVISTQASEWGTFGLVAATLDAVRRMLTDTPDLTHVYLASGACLPLRPVAELERFLGANPRTEFIESTPAEGWVQGGLDRERFTLYHPFAWKRQRWLFDSSVELQRWFRVRRRLPVGLAPRCGRQWWCLRAETLRRLLDHRDLPAWRAFFRLVWIPDESFFQTIVPVLVGDDALDPRPLTLTRFDPDGNPLVFHDDHQALLRASDHFFARKIDPDASGLRTWAFASVGHGHGAFEKVLAPDLSPPDRQGEHRGLQMAGRFPRGTGVMRPETAARYVCLVSDEADVLQRLRAVLKHRLPQAVLHGRLFGPEPAEFANGEPCYKGNLAANQALRDYRPEQFLAALIWADRAGPVSFVLDPGDNPRIWRFVSQDPNAVVVSLGGRSEPPKVLEVIAGTERYHSINADHVAEDLASGDGARIDEISRCIQGDVA